MAVALAGGVVVPGHGLALQDNAADAWGNLGEVRDYLREAEEAGFSGVVLIGRADSVVLEEGYGFAEIEHRIPMRPDHRLRIGSLTKPITASGVLAAIDRGLLSLESRPCDSLPSCPLSWREVTVRHLLTHTSGIADHFGDLESVPVEATFQELSRVLDSLPANEPLGTPPGAEYAYSNFNYVLLGALLERVAEAPWEAVLREWVFEPLELTTMAYDDVYAIVEDRARGYQRDETLGLRNIDYDDHAAYSAGGLLSSAGDVFRWARGMLEGRLFDPALVREGLTPYRGDYGYGWQVRSFFDRTIYNHSGGIDGFSSHLAHYPDADLTIVVLSNVENDLAILRACDLAARLFDWPALSTPSEPALPPRQRCGL
ncbi:MAG: serine hydrolase domain-containing protein [Myxococcota bacterium]